MEARRARGRPYSVYPELGSLKLDGVGEDVRRPNSLHRHGRRQKACSSSVSTREVQTTRHLARLANRPIHDLQSCVGDLHSCPEIRHQYFVSRAKHKLGMSVHVIASGDVQMYRL